MIELDADTREMQTGSASGASPKAKLLTLSDLDGRTRAAQMVSKTIAAIEGDLGGGDHLSTGEQQIIKRVALTGAMLEDMAARWLLGQPVDPALYATLSNAERRLLETVGLKRVSRDVTPNLASYLSARSAQAAQDSSNRSAAPNHTALAERASESRKPAEGPSTHHQLNREETL